MVNDALGVAWRQRHTAMRIRPATRFVAVERHTADTLPTGWDSAALQPARQFGDAWLTESRTAILVVPSVVARAEFNVLINPVHPDATRIVVTAPQPVVWDERLFVMPPAGRS
ncbi:RES family NAD+ phosphorylase [Burkholderia pseudomultivorans]|uniref:RES domain-containing protein n=2 Tax=Burkholderia pseudomultivorans TaxID=1207504 RepID=A0ABU2E3J0_9BURK|nr:RES domain-containing protein [Burkholderia pseudomultivorans]MDR8726067.1 hypothetical protein [Burkholderia pseudomultivorans]MDR8735037.1 hypothetical protein [Burkholderia pseudomultivorans]MDR8741142.1 hypothetical protein [Burkholderia pseudomultivorans]MDR8754306.1 hypothetical protein [Burkholderia pseudomultivorans]MDR8777417.1 hypothetical protein [Burkholderia pseudomultivorans]